jgi:tRNA pseudouridine65 synthase
MVHDSALARGETDFAADRLRAPVRPPDLSSCIASTRATSGCLLLAFDRRYRLSTGWASYS